MGVWHNTADKVGLGLVEGGHQVVKLALEVGGHGFPALALLPVLVFGGFQRLSRVISKALDCKGIRSILNHLHLFEKIFNKMKII